MQTINNDIQKIVCGVTILYNPEKVVVENIDSYIHQIDYLYIIDNSEFSSDFVKSYYMSNNKVEFIFNNENLGIAAVLNASARRALGMGFQYLLTMDQDSKAPLNLVSSCVSIFGRNNNVGLVTPIHGNKYGTHIKPVAGKTEKINMAMTSGNLISLDVYNKVGGFDEDFFLDYMDIEYCFKLHLHNYDLIRIDDFVLDHNEADLTEISIFKKKVHPHNHKPFRWYYKTRNMFYLRKKYKNIFPELFKIEFNAYLRMIARLILFEKYKVQKIKMILLGYWDFLNNKKGKKF